MMTLKAILKKASLFASGVLAFSLFTFPGNPVLSADQWKYVGITTDQFDGSQGYFAPHRACEADWGGVWCTTQMVVEGGPAKGAIDPPFTPDEQGAWIQPAPTGGNGDGVWDFSGRFFPPSTINCNYWVSDSPAFSGLVIRTQLGVVDIANLICGTDRPAACCTLEGDGPPER